MLGGLSFELSRECVDFKVLWPSSLSEQCALKETGGELRYNFLARKHFLHGILCDLNHTGHTVPRIMLCSGNFSLALSLDTSSLNLLHNQNILKMFIMFMIHSRSYAKHNGRVCGGGEQVSPKFAT